MEGGLYVVATPIGNLDDVTRRAVDALRDAEVVYAEDTRRTGRLLEALGARGPLRSLHEHNEARRTEEILERLAEGAPVTLVSDAGTPSVSDPGTRVVAAAHAAGHPVVPVPGASAVTAALSVSGLPADRFVFLGYPPRGGGEREAWMDDLEASTLTAVAFESPRRLEALLAELEERGLGERTCVLCREMTKKFEEVRRGSVAGLLARLEGREVKGEVTLVLEAGEEPGPGVPPDAVRAAARKLLEAGASTRDVADHLQEAYGLSRNAAYDLALETAGGGG